MMNELSVIVKLIRMSIGRVFDSEWEIGQNYGGLQQHDQVLAKPTDGGAGHVPPRSRFRRYFSLLPY